MTDEPERRDWLAAARERTGRSQEALAHDLGVSTKAVSYWERGLTMPRVDIRRPLAETLGLTLDELSRRLGLASAPDPASLNGGHIDPFSRVTEWLSLFVRAEQSALSIWTFEVTALPPLCQTAGYATAIELAGHRPVTPDEVDQLVQIRMERAAVLDTSADFTALIPAYLLHATKGDVGVMAEQNAHLLNLADRPNVTLHVIEPEHLSVAPGPFTLLATAGPTPDTVAEFTFTEPNCRHARDVVADRYNAFGHLRSLAHSVASSRDLMARSAARFSSLAEMSTVKGTP